MTPEERLDNANQALKVILSFAKPKLVNEDAMDAFDYIAETIAYVHHLAWPDDFPNEEKLDFDAAFNAITTITSADGAVRSFLNACGLNPKE